MGVTSSGSVFKTGKGVFKVKVKTFFNTMLSQNQIIILGLICSIIQLIQAQEPGPQIQANSTNSDRLRHKLLLNYDKISRPAEYNNTTTVKFGIEIKHLEMDEFKSTINVHSWAKMVSFPIVFLLYE